MTTEHLIRVLQRLAGRKILLLGDLMLDEYIWGQVTRISPEAPVPVVRVRDRSFRPGGAGNVAANLRALGAEVVAFSIIGDDETGRELLGQLDALGVDTRHIVASRAKPTVRKTRVIAHSQQVVRIDEEDTSGVDEQAAQALSVAALEELPRVDAVLISDYDKGVVTKSTVQALIAEGLNQGKVVAADAKPPNFPLCQGVTLITPNEAEAGAGAGVAVTDDQSLGQAAQLLFSRLGVKHLLITRGEKGMSLFSSHSGSSPLHIPAVVSEVYDVTGAGDTVIACATLALAAGASEEEAAYLANYAAGVVVKKVGTATASCQEIESLIQPGSTTLRHCSG